MPGQGGGDLTHCLLDEEKKKFFKDKFLMRGKKNHSFNKWGESQ